MDATIVSKMQKHYPVLLKEIINMKLGLNDFSAKEVINKLK